MGNEALLLSDMPYWYIILWKKKNSMKATQEVV